MFGLLDFFRSMICTIKFFLYNWFLLHELLFLSSLNHRLLTLFNLLELLPSFITHSTFITLFLKTILLIRKYRLNISMLIPMAFHCIQAFFFVLNLYLLNNHAIIITTLVLFRLTWFFYSLSTMFSSSMLIRMEMFMLLPIYVGVNIFLLYMGMILVCHKISFCVLNKWDFIFVKA